MQEYVKIHMSLGKKYISKRKPRKGQNRIKTGQKWEACRSQEKIKAVVVDKGRKTKENAKRMVENAYTVKKLFKLLKKEEKKGA
nr:hypothetical protein [Tanacetum cinerariifolium]